MSKVRSVALIIGMFVGASGMATSAYFMGRSDETAARIPIEIGRGCAHYTEAGEFTWGAQWAIDVSALVDISAPPPPVPQPQHKPPVPKRGAK